MIRINLLAAERTLSKPQRTLIPAAQRVTLGAGILIVATAAGIGWWYWSLQTESRRIDAEIARAETETQQLRSVLSQVQKFETRKAQLQQRVTLIERLRKGQTAPVHLLDEISRSVPDRLWLTGMTQQGPSFTLDGQTTSLTALSDFVANLEASPWFKRPVEIVDSQVDHNPQTGELVRFTVKANMNDAVAAGGAAVKGVTPGKQELKP
jgi:type IV pilus assembly protein PilN